MRIIKIQFIIILLLFAFPVLAQDTSGDINSLQIGEYSVDYDESENVNSSHTVYKKEGKIVLSGFDTDENGSVDLWLRYREDMILDLEASDSDGDGEADTFATLDAEENVVGLVAPEFELAEVNLEPNPNPAKKEVSTQPTKTNIPDIFVVGPPPTENKFSFSFVWVLLILAVGIAGFFMYKNKKKK